MKGKTAIDVYINEIKKQVPLIGKKEKLFLQQITEDVNKLCIDTAMTYEEIKSAYGEPKDIVDNYIKEYDSEELKRLIKQRKCVKTLSMVAAVLLVSLSTACITLSMRSNKKETEDELEYCLSEDESGEYISEDENDCRLEWESVVYDQNGEAVLVTTSVPSGFSTKIIDQNGNVVEHIYYEYIKNDYME